MDKREVNGKKIFLAVIDILGYAFGINLNLALPAPRFLLVLLAEETMEKIKAIFCDFDWTLFDHKTRSFNTKGVEGLGKAHEKGVKLIVNSARSYHSLRGLRTFDVIPFDGFVVSNGGAALLDRDVLYADYIDEKKASVIKAYLDSNGFSYNLITLHDSFLRNADERIIEDFYRVFYEPRPFDISAYNGERPLAIQVFAYEKDEGPLKQLSASLGLVYNRFAENAVELTPIEFKKSKGVDAIFKAMGLSKEEAMAFGDDLNDIPMFESVKYSVCLGNGKKEAKEAAYYVTDPIDEDGLSKALAHFGVI